MHVGYSRSPWETDADDGPLTRAQRNTVGHTVGCIIPYQMTGQKQSVTPVQLTTGGPPGYTSAPAESRYTVRRTEVPEYSLVRRTQAPKYSHPSRRQRVPRGGPRAAEGTLLNADNRCVKRSVRIAKLGRR